MDKTIVLIPSRLQASRLPNKPLLRINNKSLIMHVYENAKKSDIGEVYVATGDDLIFDEVTENGAKCIKTSLNHHTGTDRIYEAFNKIDKKDINYVINLQGDEPLINIEDIKKLKMQTIKHKSEISTLACEIKDQKKLDDENIVKVKTIDKISSVNITRAINFSRKTSNKISENIYHHVGIYIYKTTILKKFTELPQTNEEKKQKLEQLRALENDIKIDVVKASTAPIGVDTQNDYMEIKKLMEYKK